MQKKTRGVYELDQDTMQKYKMMALRMDFANHRNQPSVKALTEKILRDWIAENSKRLAVKS